MRKLLILLLVMLSGALYGQLRTTGITYTVGIPTHTPSASQGSLIAIDTVTKLIYGYYGVWKDLGATLQFTGSASAPTGAPTDFTSRFAINTVDSVYAYYAGTWRHLNKAADLTPYVEWSDTLTFISTRQDLIDTAAAIRGAIPVIAGFVEWSDTLTFISTRQDLIDTAAAIRGDFPIDTATYVVQDSIAVYYANGLEFSRDTIRFPAVDLTPYVEWSDTLTFISTQQDLIDTAVALRGDFPIDTATFLIQDSITVYYANGIEFGRDTVRFPPVNLTGYLEWSDTLTYIVTTQDLSDTSAAIRGDFPVLVQDTVTLLSQDSILIYYEDGGEVGRDTIRFPLVNLTSYLEWSDTLTYIVTTQDLKDTSVAIRGDFPILVQDTVTLLTQDSILVYYEDGGEVGRDTIKFPALNLSGYLEWSDTLTYISTLQDLADTSAAIRGDFPVVSDTATFLVQDTILVYYANGIEFDRDTINIPTTVDLTAYVEWADTLTFISTRQDLIDTAAAIRGALVQDTVTLLTQDSIIIYYVDGGEIFRDTIRTPVAGGDDWGAQVAEVLFGLIGDGTTGNELEVDSSSVATLYALQDSCSDIRTALATNLTIGGSGPTYIIESSTGADVTISAAGIATLSEPSANELRITATMPTITLSGDVTGAGTTAITTDISTGVIGPNELASTAVTPGSYTAADITVDADGRITAAANGSGATNLTVGGSGPTYIIESSTGTDVTVSAAGIATLSEPSANELRVTATEAQGLTVTGSGPSYVIDIAGGTDVTISAAGTISLSESTANELLITGAASTDTVEMVRGYIEGQTGTSFDLDAYDFKTKDVDGDTIYFDIPTNLDNFKVFKNGVELNRTGSGTTRDYSANASTNVLTLVTALTTDDRLIVQNTTGSGYIGYESVNPPTVETLETTTFTASRGVIHLVDCSAAARTVNPFASPQVNDRFAISDATASSATNNITIDFTTASQKLYGTVQNYILNRNGAYVEFIYAGSTTGWIATK